MPRRRVRVWVCVAHTCESVPCVRCPGVHCPRCACAHESAGALGVEETWGALEVDEPPPPLARVRPARRDHAVNVDAQALRAVRAVSSTGGVGPAAAASKESSPRHSWQTARVPRSAATLGVAQRAAARRLAAASRSASWRAACSSGECSAVSAARRRRLARVRSMTSRGYVYQCCGHDCGSKPSGSFARSGSLRHNKGGGRQPFLYWSSSFWLRGSEGARSMSYR